MKNAKHTMLAIFTVLPMYALFLIIDGTLLNPYAGGETHRLLNRPGGISFESAAQVLLEYVAAMSAIIIALTCFRFRIHWTLLAASGTLIILNKWHGIQCLLNPKEWHSMFSIITSFIAVAFIIGVAALSSFLLRPRRMP
jgi:hypothetical protein